MFHVKHSPSPDPGILPHLQRSLADVCNDAQVHQQLALHWQLLCQWNQQTNLTAIHTPERAAWVHYRDSLAGLAHLQGGPLVDLGTGPGFPGLVLAIARPNWEVWLVEPRRRRLSFLHTAVARLGLRRVQVLAGKMQQTPPQPFAHVVTRATFSQAADLQHACAWLQPGGSLLAWRAADAGPLPGSQRYPYDLAGQARCIDILPGP